MVSKTDEYFEHNSAQTHVSKVLCRDWKFSEKNYSYVKQSMISQAPVLWKSELINFIREQTEF